MAHGISVDIHGPLPRHGLSISAHGGADAATVAAVAAPALLVLPELGADIDEVLHGVPAIGGDAGLLGEPLFRSALNRERHRADRFNEAFALFTLDLPGVPTHTIRLSDLIGTIRNTIRDTDVVGWISEGSVLGLILTGLPPSTGAIASQVEARIRRELSGRVGSLASARLQLRSYVHSAPGSRSAEGFADDDPLVDAVRQEHARRVVLEVTKRGIDLAGSLILLALLAPVLVLVAVIVSLTSRGPVLFRQVRVGRFGKPFTMLKFRTMRVESDDSLHQAFVAQFIQARDAATSQAERVYKMVNDPRVTPLGRVLRRTSLDELPQLWNVLRGEMSLVGPRPPVQYELDHYRPWHWRRVLSVRPGITGLWQVTGRSLVTFDEMVRLDLRYVATRSLLTDLRILLATPRAVLSRKGAW